MNLLHEWMRDHLQGAARMILFSFKRVPMNTLFVSFDVDMQKILVVAAIVHIRASKSQMKEERWSRAKER